MKPIESFESAALRANLERTRSQPPRIPRDHQDLLDATVAFYGVNNRLQQFLEEFHHRYPNKEWIAAQLRAIALQDFWYYSEHERGAALLLSLVRICESLLSDDSSVNLHRRTFQTLVEFVEHCVTAERPERLTAAVDAALDVLDAAMNSGDMLGVVSGSILRSIPANTPVFDAYRARLVSMLRTAQDLNLAFWRNERYMEQVLDAHEELLGGEREGLLRDLGEDAFEELHSQTQRAASWDELQKIPDYMAIAERFRAAADHFTSPLQRAYYLSAILPVPGLEHLKEHLLWDLNRVLRSVWQGGSSGEEMSTFLIDLFEMLGRLRADHMSTVLECLLTLGRIIFAADDPVQIDQFTDALIDFGFVYPDVRGVDEDWQVRMAHDHVKNIRVWLELIKSNPRRSARLLSALIIQLKLGGVFIQDNDLFQRDVTAVLNAEIRPVMFLVKQLAILFPVYFNEIGAEGELREISTVIDEIAGRRDRLVHFLRKQIHAESNNTHLQLTGEILRYWESGDETALRTHLPEDVLESLADGKEWWEMSHRVIVGLCTVFSCRAEELPMQPQEKLATAATTADPASSSAVRRVLHLCRIHQLLNQKYSIAVEDIIPHMEKLHVIRNFDIDEFRALLEADNPEKTLDFVLIMLRRLHSVILDAEPSQGREEIYYKRHIAAGIPSMYGRYMEPKFQALGLAYRFEALATQMLTRIIEETNLDYITAATLRRIHRILVLFRRSLEIEGYSDEGFTSSVEMLRFSLSTTSFTIHQYINLFQFLADNVKNIIHNSFIAPHELQLVRIIPQHLALRGDGSAEAKEVHVISERVYRDLISSTFPIQQLDNFIASVLSSMNDMLVHLTPDVIMDVMGYDSRLVTTRLTQANQDLDNPVFLGSKGYYLKRLYALGFPVPPGFILTTELFRRRDAILKHPDMMAEVQDLLRKRLRQLESIVNERYGDPSRPLLLSVRSGAAISIPGAMNTFLNVGMNDHIVEGLSKRENYGWTSWDCYRRFLQNWGMSVGVPRDEFDAVIVDFKERYGVELKNQFAPAVMRTIALTYKQVLLDHGVHIEEEPFKQLIQAVLMVLESWYTERAQVYRRKLQIAEDWGTAVLIQRMVLGNLNYDSGSGVLFSHDPFVRESGISLFGDFTVCSQGEDIVAGLVHTLPISERQRVRSQIPVAQSLEKDFPEVFRTLERFASSIVYEHNFGHQEIEFTFETSKEEDVYILQTRDHSPLHEREMPVFEIGAVKDAQVGSGIGIGGGAMNGRVCFDMDDLRRLHAEMPGENLILVRPDTVPDDIGMIFECEGLLTARGGATSHAAVTAVRLRKTCVVDCRALQVNEGKKTCTINGVPFRPGDAIAIDGRIGSIYRGSYPVSYVQIHMP